MDFVAIDFETANSDRASICQVGAAVVRGGAITEVYEWVVNPVTGLDNFNLYNVRLHKLTPQEAKAGLSWEASAKKLSALVDGLPVVAHNVSFDRNAYLDACVRAGITAEQWVWHCSKNLCQRKLSELESAKLKVVTAHLGIPLDAHHQGGADAVAAAGVVLTLAERSKASSLEEFCAPVTQPRPSRGRAGQRSRSGSSIPQHVSSKYSRTSDLPAPNSAAAPDHPLFRAHVVVTGHVPGLTRDDLIDDLAAVGAQPQLNVTKKTTVLAVGENAGVGKRAKAEQYIQAGQAINIIPMAALLEQLGTKDDADAPPVSEGQSSSLQGRADLAGEPVDTVPEQRHAESQLETVHLSTTSAPAPQGSSALPGGVPSGGDNLVADFQQWPGPPGSLPAGWKLTCVVPGGVRTMSASALNKPMSTSGRRVGVVSAILVLGFLFSWLLLPIIAALALAVFYVLKSRRNDRMRAAYWSSARQVLHAVRS